MDVLFIGWTVTMKQSIHMCSDTAPTTVANVDINGDMVYAAWGVDTNGDGVPGRERDRQIHRHLC